MAANPGVNATISLDQAAARSWHAVVLGAGPAGAMAAHALAVRGRRVLLIEKKSFPRYKVCGGCLNQRAIENLHDAGISGVLREVPMAALHRIVLAQGRRRANVALTGGGVIARDAFDAAMVRAAVAAGADFLPSTTARVKELIDTQESPLGRIVEARDAAQARDAGQLRDSGQACELRAAVVLLASGLSGVRGGDADAMTESVASGARIGIGAIVENPPAALAAQAIWMAIGKRGYVGAARLADGRLNVAAAIDPAWMKAVGGASPAITALLRDANLPQLALRPQQHWQGTPLLTRQSSDVAGARLLLAGDAAGYVEPFTGEGMAWALSAGHAAALVVDAGIENWNTAHEKQWRATYRALVTARQRSCRWLAAWLRWPLAVRAGIAAITLAPALGRAVERTLARSNVAATSWKTPSDASARP